MKQKVIEDIYPQMNGYILLTRLNNINIYIAKIMGGIFRTFFENFVKFGRFDQIDHQSEKFSKGLRMKKKVSVALF